ncbi:MAG: hypothetical protein DRJ07_06070 [Bacteroidetes bacterium]|nr:MAG: hypothetical protein DRJ07_06070 [Bacteroidota bacterium]
MENTASLYQTIFSIQFNPLLYVILIKANKFYMQNKWFSLVFILVLSIPVFGQEKWPDSISTIQIDSIKISKNWRTKDKIIKSELGINPGMQVTKVSLYEGITKIWNMGNFSNVAYQLDTLPDKRILLKVEAKDAFTIMPNLSFSGNKEDFRFTAGVIDNNFLGRNLRIGLNANFGSNGTDFSASLTIPRQLLYKNMSLYGSVVYGRNQQYQYTEGEKISGVGYKKKQFSLGISNPWSQDFKYNFSPNLGISYFQHETDSTLIDADIPTVSQYTINYISVGVSESIGYIKRKRHQKNGYLVYGSIGWGIGLDSESPQYMTLGLSAGYHKLFNKTIQFSTHFSTGYTTSDIPSLLFYKGNSSVKGIINGEISGKAYYTTYTGLHFTYLNLDWFALEQSFFVNWGNGSDDYMDIYTTKPLATVGSGIRLMVPMIPWLGIRFYFTKTMDHDNWFTIDL